MNSTVCTLFEGDYHFGVGALVNSLYSHGFRGTIWAGFRGELPPWAVNVQIMNNSYRYTVADNCEIYFVPVDTSLHLAKFKARFMLDVCDKLGPSSEAVFYFDPDITVRGDWCFFERWVTHGVALCEDNVYSHMPDDHPFRAAWKDFAEQKGYHCHRQLNQYFNSGFVGFSSPHRQALYIWQDLIASLEEVGVKPEDFQRTDRSNPFYGTDQDALNIAAMVTQAPLSTIGPEGMDFKGGGYTMSHAATAPKPWKKHFVRSAVGGVAPSMADKTFLANIHEPIRLYASWEECYKKFDERCGAAIGRFISKS